LKQTNAVSLGAVRTRPNPSDGSCDKRTQSGSLDDALDTAEIGVSVSDDFDWLFERCGEGAFAVAGSGTDEDESDESPNDFAVDEDRLSEFRTLVNQTGAASVMVVDSHETSHVTRSGFAFDSTADELASLIAEGASETNILTEDTLVVVEAFWE
jgi:hypothetical protein